MCVLRFSGGRLWRGILPLARDFSQRKRRLQSGVLRWVVGGSGRQPFDVVAPTGSGKGGSDGFVGFGGKTSFLGLVVLGETVVFEGLRSVGSVVSVSVGLVVGCVLSGSGGVGS